MNEETASAREAACNENTTDRLFPLVYEQLRRLAAKRMAGAPAGQSLQPTALVHEAWMRLSKSGELSWKNRAHFFGAAAQAMRQIMVDRFRRKTAEKRRFADTSPKQSQGEPLAPEPGEHVLLIHESLRRLDAENPNAAQVVLFRFFCGLSVLEIAQMSGRSARSVERLWTYAKVRLYQIVREEGYARGDGS